MTRNDWQFMGWDWGTVSIRIDPLEVDERGMESNRAGLSEVHLHDVYMHGLQIIDLIMIGCSVCEPRGLACDNMPNGSKKFSRSVESIDG